MAELKYVMFEMDNSLLTAPEQFKRVCVPFIFPKFIVHSDVDEFCHLLLRRSYRANNVEAVSAGFYNSETGSTYGESESLDLKSRPEDSEIIKNMPSYIPDFKIFRR